MAGQTGGRGDSVTRPVVGYLAKEVGAVGEDRPLVGARPDVVLHHVLLLRQVAVELCARTGQRVSNCHITGQKR